MEPIRHPAKKATAHREKDGVVRAVVLRHYAANLRRSWRNSPREAFTDATYQVEALIAVILTASFGIINLLLSRTIAPSLARSIHGKSNGVLLLTVIVLVVMIAIDRKLKQFEPHPGVPIGYDTPRDRRLVYCYYAFGFVVIGIALVGAHYINLALPP